MQAWHTLSGLIAQMKTAPRFFFPRAAVMYHFSVFWSRLMLDFYEPCLQLASKMLAVAAFAV
jgi:hypothetical protein